MIVGGFGVLHEWIEDGDVKSYVIGPWPTEGLAELALASQTCDCTCKVIRVMFPDGVLSPAWKGRARVRVTRSCPTASTERGPTGVPGAGLPAAGTPGGA
jgi:hypothetical protein